MHYLFGPKGMRALRAITSKPALYAFDFDGTLAGIARNPRTVRVAERTRHWLGRLTSMAPTAVVSGRSLEDIRTRVGRDVTYLIGNHGLEGGTADPRAIDRARDVTCGWKDILSQGWRQELVRAGVMTEDKTYSLSFHYRNAENPGAARRAIFRALAGLTPQPRVVPGKRVFNALPPGTPHKGGALLELIRQLDVAAAVYIGDDDTDEDVFALRDPRILTARVGHKKTSAAQFFLRRRPEVSELLCMLAEQLLQQRRARVRSRRHSPRVETQPAGTRSGRRTDYSEAGDGGPAGAAVEAGRARAGPANT